GAVYTYFVDSGLLWSAFVEKLFAIDGATGDNFGSSVAISGNGLILVAGAPNATATINNNHISGTGAIYTFTRRPDTPAGWNRNPVNGSAANDSAYGDQFGSGIALSDDGTTLAVSSPRASLDVGGVIVKNAGAVYIYNSSFIGDSVWGNPIKLVSDEITESNAFGKNIFLTGDGLTLYVAEPSLAVSTDKTTVLGAGAIHIYHRQGNNWIRGQKLIDNNPTSQEQFGFEFSLSTDGSTIIVSAPYSDVKIDNTIIRRTGKALVFRRQKIGTDWNLIPALVLTARDPAEFDYFGYSVAISGDGRNISVGAPGAANIQPNIGPIQNIGVFYEF
ncbi:MAG: hypothetical protein ACC707_21130, partial [Thiohalomonadales bacterium]